jgi:hypothetical protein
MLWSRKRKEMRNRADGNSVSVQRRRLLDCQPTNYQGPNERVALTIGAIAYTSKDLWGARLILKMKWRPTQGEPA